MNTWFSSDLHFFHKNICKYCGRPWTFEEQTEQLITRWNSRVGEYDDAYHLGDFAFASRKQYNQVIEIIKQLNGNLHFIRGNHCDEELWEMIERANLPHVVWVKDYAKIRVQGQKVILSHYPYATWDSAHHGSWHLFGHCVDMETELLTVNGWKKFGEFDVDSEVYTYDHHTGKIKISKIEQVFNPVYTGEVFTLSGKSANLRMTKDHRVVGKLAHSGKYVECTPVSVPKSRMKLIHSGFSEKKGISLTNEQIRLYVYCTADGSFKSETGLWRIRVKKEHKKTEIDRVLRALGIDFNRYDNGQYSSFNFYFDIGMNPKGLDRKLVDMTDEQFSIFIDAYSLSDGSKSGRGVVLTTAKRGEADLIQEMAVTHGWSCTSQERIGHGFSKNPSWSLSVFPRTDAICSHLKEMTVENVNNEPFWCIKTEDGNFFVRRNGKVHLTGNCHGSFKGIGKSMDVGIDAHPDFQVFSWNEICAEMAKKEYHQLDHHEGGGR